MRSSIHGRIRLGVKLASLALIALALFQPVYRYHDRRTEVRVLLDKSRRLTTADARALDELQRNLGKAQGRNVLQFVDFGGKAGAGTDLEDALVSNALAFSGERVPRLLLVSNANETRGSSVRALVEASGLSIPADTMPISKTGQPALVLQASSAPATAWAGEQIPIDLDVEAARPMVAAVHLVAEEKPIGDARVQLASGENHVQLHARIHSEGVLQISGTVNASGEERRWSETIQMRRPRVLYLSQDPGGSDQQLLDTFTHAGYDVTRDLAAWQREPGKFHLLVLNNADLNDFDGDTKSRIASFVQDGGGLLLIGGERQVYKDDTKLDALDRALPAKLAPPQQPEGVCVALIVDKSSSMEGRKIELARSSAAGVVEHLRPVDSIGVLIFDNSYQWAVPIRKAEDKPFIRRLISGITPDGGTQIAPALSEAYRRISQARASSRHIVLLTDGISEEGDSMELSREAKSHGITISTVGLGQDVNRSYLEKVADSSGGKSYFLNDPSGLEQILLKDVQDFSGSTAVERPLTPTVKHPAQILNDTGMERAPALKGYARYQANPQADTVLEINSEKHDPLYVHWQYGLGHAAVFTSDAKSRWAADWIGWDGYDRFWINATRDLLPRVSGSAGSAHFDAATESIRVEYRIQESREALSPGRPANGLPSIYAIGPEGFHKPVTMQRTGPGLFAGAVHIGNARGLFRIRPLNESAQVMELGLLREGDDTASQEPNVPLLKRIAASTGGHFQPAPASVFDSGGHTLERTLPLWPLCLGSAIALTVLELILRKRLPS